MVGWNCVLELNTERQTVAGSEKALAGCDKTWLRFAGLYRIYP